MKNTIKIKTIQRIVGIIALAVIIGITVIACSGGGGGGKLSGTFEYEGSTRTFSGNKVTFQRDDYKSESTFTISGDELTITAADGDVTKLKYTLSGKTLTLDGGGGVQTWTKK